ncbi:MAG: hypothetical protein ABMA64_25450 [Myxococcota bacterium]
MARFDMVSGRDVTPAVVDRGSDFVDRMFGQVDLIRGCTTARSRVIGNPVMSWWSPSWAVTGAQGRRAWRCRPRNSLQALRIGR